MTIHNEQQQFVDPVCGMAVDPATAPAKTCHDGVEIYFCAEGCKKRFDADPVRYASTNTRRGFWRRYLDRLNKARQMDVLINSFGW